jgi:hypothetical protein
MSNPNESPDDQYRAALSKARDVFATARTIVGTSWPYLLSAVMRLVPRWDPRVPTVGVDQFMRLYMNPVFVSGLSGTSMALLLASHELQHVLGDHYARLTNYRDYDMGATGTGQWSGSFSNICHDLSINCQAEAYAKSAEKYRASAGETQLKFALPQGAAYPKAFSDVNGTPLRDGLLPEEYAELLDFRKTPRSDQQRGEPGPQCGPGSASGTGTDKCRSCGSGGGDRTQPWEDGTEPDPTDPTTGSSQIEVEAIRRATAEEAVKQNQKARGSVPGGQLLWAESYLRPSKINWRALLRRHVRTAMDWAAGQSEFTWRRPSKRSPRDIILPSLLSPEPDFVFGIDSSGSMTPKDYDVVFREAHAVLKTFGYREVPVFTCDTQVSDVQYVTSVTDIRIVGGGGTDMGNAVAKAAELGKKVVIVMTDGITGWGEPPRSMKVIACLTQPATDHYPVPDWVTSVVCND